MAVTRARAHELGPHGITVNCVCPGYVLDAMDFPSSGLGRADPWSALSPLGRLADTGDIARAALFLASSDSDYLTGTRSTSRAGCRCTDRLRPCEPRTGTSGTPSASNGRPNPTR